MTQDKLINWGFAAVRTACGISVWLNGFVFVGRLVLGIPGAAIVLIPLLGSLGMIVYLELLQTRLARSDEELAAARREDAVRRRAHLRLVPSPRR